MTGIVSVYAIFADADEAARIGRIAVEERLAACVNILTPCRSIYRWQGKIEEAEEVPALFKTRADRAESLIARIAELHSYDVPAAVAWPVKEALAAYTTWITEETSF
ncbi:MAG: divalent-cation tolerance protein CutA [Sphingomonas sp.]|nr:divalent-cation tolerance protein CutA [Sphingomonas sp.]